MSDFDGDIEINTQVNQQPHQNNFEFFRNDEEPIHNQAFPVNAGVNIDFDGFNPNQQAFVVPGGDDAYGYGAAVGYSLIFRTLRRSRDRKLGEERNKREEIE